VVAPLRAGTRLVEVVRALDAAGIDAHDVHRREVTLDDVFLSITQSRAAAAPARDPQGARMSHLISDSLVLARRNLEHVRQIPEKLLDVTLQPIMFVILFAYVFGGVIAIPDGSYREYLLGGVLVQSLSFGVVGPATSIATDLREGVVDRFRSLPISRSAYLIGHILAELAASLIAITVLSLSGWSSAGASTPASCMRSPATAHLAVCVLDALVWHAARHQCALARCCARGRFMVIFPMTFLASTFVPIAGFSPLLRVLASWNPVSSLAAAVRWLFGNPTGTPADAAWPLQHPVVSALGWCLAILALCVPLALRRFRHEPPASGQRSVAGATAGTFWRRSALSGYEPLFL
jgi:hypothetical protein